LKTSFKVNGGKVTVMFKLLLSLIYLKLTFSQKNKNQEEQV